MQLPRIKLWLRPTTSYWLFMTVVFYLELRYMDWEWSGLPGVVLTLPLSPIPVTIGLLPAIAYRYGYVIPYDMNGYELEYCLIPCAILNPLVFYLLYALWANRKMQHFEVPSPHNSGQGPRKE
jgi:hypothetical protein